MFFVFFLCPFEKCLKNVPQSKTLNTDLRYSPDFTTCCNSELSEPNPEFLNINKHLTILHQLVICIIILNYSECPKIRIFSYLKLKIKSR